MSAGLFSGNRQAELLQLPDADMRYVDDFLDPYEAEKTFPLLKSSVKWQEQDVIVWGRIHKQPRLVAWYGDEAAVYRYSGATQTPRPWTNLLLMLRQRVQDFSGEEFNSVLLNLYRDGRDGMGWHSDDEPELGTHPTIASLSLGAPRRFQLRHKFRDELKMKSIDLSSGSLLLMSGSTQQFWEHALKKETKEVGPRINLTFRKINVTKGNRR